MGIAIFNGVPTNTMKTIALSKSSRDILIPSAISQTLLSFVVPVKDEEETIYQLYSRVAEKVGSLGYAFEMIFVDDGSEDASWSKIKEITVEDSRVSGIRFRRNVGKANALTAGFEAARGEIIFTMDADLQDDPKEIGNFLDKLDEGYDVVSGWKKTRHDPWHKVLPSRVFNAMISRLIGVRLHDHNCGFKCYRANAAKSLTLYGEMHRMMPSLASLQGFHSAEIEVEHHPRLHGKSKYGVKRFLRGFMDLLTVYFLKNFRERPLHVFGGVAATSFVSGCILFLAAATHFLPDAASDLGAALMVGALPLAGLGFFAELLVSRRTKRDRELPISEVTSSPLPETCVDAAEEGDAEEDSAKPLVLLVDDDPMARAMYSSHLNYSGYRIIEAINGVDALTKVSPDVAVVLLDMRMHGGNGIDAMRALRRLHPQIKVIVVSGEDNLGGAVSMMKLGAFDYLPKPVSSGQLSLTVDRAVEVRALIEQHMV